MRKSRKITRKQAFETVAAYIVDCESNEYDNYTTWCEENGWKPSRIRGRNQSKHVYALALIALGLTYPND